MQQDDRFSDWYDKNGNCQSTDNEFSQIDHISSVFMYHDYKEFCGTYNSDHYPLVVDFEFYTFSHLKRRLYLIILPEGRIINI
jgi:hypothetical protein